MEPANYHNPVLLGPSVDGLNIKSCGTYVDVTLGGGGHSREILRRLGPEGRLYSFDQDEDAIVRSAAASAQSGGRWQLVRSNFRYLKNWMRYYGVTALDGVLADLGVSSHHFDAPARGFSFRTDAVLDMRMNRQGGQTAADVLASYSETQLADIFRLYGELRQGARLASAIVRERQRREILTTGELAALLTPLLGRDREKKDLARAFQALRIEVNHEMDALREMLNGATNLLKEGGRLSVITYHSLEDRIVKNVMKAGNAEGKMNQDFFGRVQTPFKLVDNKVIVPNDEEQTTNPRSRSAKLRIAEKI